MFAAGRGWFEDNFTSTYDSGDSIDISDRTLSFTSILGGVRDMEISGEASLAGDDENIARRISQISFPTTNASTDTVSAGSSSSHAPCLSSVFSAPAPAIHETSTKSSAFSQEPSTVDFHCIRQ